MNDYKQSKNLILTINFFEMPCSHAKVRLKIAP